MFRNRLEAGKQLADKLAKYTGGDDSVVLGIPRGGVVIAKEVASVLRISFSIIIVKKLRSPDNAELAIGAVSDGANYVDADLALRIGVSQEYLDKEIQKRQQEVKEKMKKYRTSLVDFQKMKNFILTDDGVATGATIKAAISYLKKKSSRRDGRSNIVLAVPVIAKETYNQLQSEVNRIVALKIPEFFGSVGQFYEEFPQVSDEEVLEIINQSTN